MIKVVHTGQVAEDTRRIIHALNFSEAIHAVTPSLAAFSTGAPALGANLVGGLVVDRSIFRTVLPDARWFVYAAGLVNPGDGNTATVALQYVKDTGVLVMLGSATAVGAGWAKLSMGPFDVFGTAGVPAGETIPAIVMTAQKNAGVNGTLSAWTIWTRFLASKQ
jgi:hypothetical protein